MNDYDYSLKKHKKRDISFGGMIHAIALHCGFALEFGESLVATDNKKALQPFKREYLKEIKPQSKVYGCHNLDIRLLADKYREAREKKKFDLAITTCNIAINVDRVLSYKSEKEGDPTLLGDLAEIYFESG